jgi:hypothetical protein
MSSEMKLSGLWVYGIGRHFQQYFSYIVVVGFIGGGNRCTQRKPSTWHKSPINVFTVVFYYLNVPEIWLDI